MDELHMCHYCGQPLEDLSQLHDITHCAKYAIETSIPALQKRVEELETHIKEAVKEIEEGKGKWHKLSIAGSEEEYDEYYGGISNGLSRAVEILRKHGLMEDK